MKIDRYNPKHWFYLVAFGVIVLLAVVARLLRRRRARQTIALYGHRLGGNLLAIYEEVRSMHADEFEIVFIALDPLYASELADTGAVVVNATSLRCTRLLFHADALITDHGLHSMVPLLWWSDLKFFDVWHGIPFKGFDADDFKVQHRYDETWVASTLLKSLYVERFGFNPAAVVATGYARTDKLVLNREDQAGLREQFGLPSSGPVVLFAPTWKQDSAGRSLYPFGLSEAKFLERLTQLAERYGAIIAMRAHLNSVEEDAETPHVVHVPFAKFPDTEALLTCSDILVCDWSSIAFDFLLLNRPTLFLDVEPPFRKGFSLGPDNRFGAVVGDMNGLCEWLETSLADPAVYQSTFGAAHASARARVYENFADGRAAARCVERLRFKLASESSR